MLDALRNHDAPELRPDMLAASGAIGAPLPRHARRIRDRIGDAAGVLIIVGLVLAALLLT